jgi:DNA-binding NarL/FixJ family response regulator
LLLDARWIGAHGYLQKTLSGSEMLKVLKYVQQGKRIVDEPYATTRGLNDTTRITEGRTSPVWASALRLKVKKLATVKFIEYS